MCHTPFPASEVQELVLSLEISDSVSTSLQILQSGFAASRRCETCGMDQQHFFTTNFGDLPEVLIIRLLRSDFNAHTKAPKKLGGEMICDKVLSIGSVLNSDSEPVKYHLSSVIHHTGTPINGHYTATLLQGNNTMRSYNDHYVNRINRLDHKTAYILFYRKQI